MPDRTKFLMFGRRMTAALKSFANDGGGSDPVKWAKERPHFEHAASGIFLAGSLAYLVGKYGEEPKAWKRAGTRGSDFDTFVQKNDNFSKARISKSGLDALVCIRNALTHNDGDLALNDDKKSLAKVTGANLDGVVLNGSTVSLTLEFMEYVRLAYVAVAQYHGDG